MFLGVTDLKSINDINYMAEQAIFESTEEICFEYFITSRLI